MASGKDIAGGIAKGIEVLAKIGQIEHNVMPYATFIAGFFPGAASVLAAIAIAQPYIDKAVAAAPLLEKAVSDGAPIIDAIQSSGPGVLSSLKHAYAIFANADPARPEEGMTAADVSDEEAVKFAGPVMLGRPWTAEEEARFFAKADGSGMRDGLGNQTGSW